jgi:hypothetical protein
MNTQDVCVTVGFFVTQAFYLHRVLASVSDNQSFLWPRDVWPSGIILGTQYLENVKVAVPLVIIREECQLKFRHLMMFPLFRHVCPFIWPDQGY